MASAAQVRGLILEEFVLKLLVNAGYRILNEEEGDEIRNGHNGLELQGRGEWHQIDALVGYDHTPAFIYPIRLIVEAKAYLPSSYTNGHVSLQVIRNAVGVLKDVNENYFSHSIDSSEFKYKRFNYAYAIFSLNGFTRNAQRYAIAHQIFLIQYYHNRLFDAVRHTLFQINDKNLYLFFPGLRDISLNDFRLYLRKRFDTVSDIATNDISLSREGDKLIKELTKSLHDIRGSYFGLLNGEYPIHITSKHPISGIENRDTIDAKVYIENAKLIKISFNNNKLFFELPDYLAQLFQRVWSKKRLVAETKRRTISYISITGIIDGIKRNLIIRLDRDWLDNYINRLKS